MDFASNFVVIRPDGEEEEEEEEEETYVAEGSIDDDSSSSDGDYPPSSQHIAYEACMMDFEEEEVVRHPTIKSGKKSSNPYNTVSFPMKTLLTEPADLTLDMTQLVTCRDCRAVLSHLDLKLEEGGKNFWKCRFCQHRQEVTSWPEFSAKDDVHYRAPLTSGQQQPSWSSDFDIPCIFVLDVSGSMSLPATDSEGLTTLHDDTRTPALARVMRQEKNARIMVLGADDNTVDVSQVTRISRLQAVKAGLIEQLDKMVGEQPVGLVTFSTGVTIHGDCTTEAITMPEVENLGVAQLEENASILLGLKPLRETRDCLVQTILSLEENGQTALGPALTVATAMCRDKKCVKVIVCTDGTANLGVGRLDVKNSDDTLYQDLTQQCKIQGVSVSILSFDDCRLVGHLGALPRETGGQVEKVSAGKVNFQKALARDLSLPTRATAVSTVFCVGASMYIRADSGQEFQDSEATKFVGNINEGSKLCYSFAPRAHNTAASTEPSAATGSNAGPLVPDQRSVDGQPGGQSDDQSQSNDPCNCSNKEATPFSDLESQEPDNPTAKPPATPANGLDPGQGSQDEMEVESQSVPFQFQVTFKYPSGECGTRVWTLEKEVTSDLSKAKETSDVLSLANNFCQTNSHTILGHGRHMGSLLLACTEGLNTLRDLLQQCKSSPSAMDMLSDYKDILTTLTKKQRMDHDLTVRLRKFDNAQDCISA